MDKNLIQLFEAILHDDKSEALPGAMDVIKAIQETGAGCWFVGGCVRDKILGRVPHDYDIITDMPYKDLEELFPENRPGAVSSQSKVIIVNGDYEVASLRGNLENNLEVRDLTMNSMAMDPVTEDIIDPTNGIQSIENQKLEFTDYTKSKLKEGKCGEALIKSFKFVSRFGWNHTADSENAIKEFLAHKGTFKRIDQKKFLDRIWDPIKLGQHFDFAVDLMKQLGIYDLLLTEHPSID